MPLTALAFLIVYIGGICAAVFNPVAGIVLYILVYHLNPQTQWWAYSIQALGSRMSFTVALATAVGMIVRRPRLEFGARQFPLSYQLAVLLALIAFGSMFWGLGVVERGQVQSDKFFKILIFVFILVRCVRTPLEYHAVFWAWLVGVAYLGYQAHGGAGYIQGGRLTGGLGGPDFAESSDLAVHLVATLPLIGAAFFMARHWLTRGATLIVGALTVNILVMTRTRNALIGLACAAVSCVLALPRGYRVRGVLAVAVGLGLSLYLTDDGWWRRMRTIVDYENDGAAQGRLAYWRAALDMVREYPFGIGIGNFHHTVMDYVPGLNIPRGAHSTPMACLAELGWPGLVVFLSIVVVTLWRLGQVRRLAHGLPCFTDLQLYRFTSRFHLGWHAVALRSAILGYLGCGLFTTRLFSEDFWTLMGLAMCLHNVAQHVAANVQGATEYSLAAELQSPAQPLRLPDWAPTPVPALRGPVPGARGPRPQTPHAARGARPASLAP